jgi:hypothetical protein
MSTEGYEIGADEHVGDDNIGDDVGAYEIGAARRPARRGMLPAAVATGIPFGMGDRVRNQGMPSRMARQILPLGIAALIPAGGTFTFQVQPQRPFRCDRLFLSSGTGLATWTVEAVTVGATPQFVATGSAPAECFARDSFGAALRGDTANPGVQVIVQVTNRGAAPADLYGAILGEALQM